MTDKNQNILISDYIDDKINNLTFDIRFIYQTNEIIDLNNLDIQIMAVLGRKKMNELKSDDDLIYYFNKSQPGVHLIDWEGDDSQKLRIDMSALPDNVDQIAVAIFSYSGYSLSFLEQIECIFEGHKDNQKYNMFYIYIPSPSIDQVKTSLNVFCIKKDDYGYWSVCIRNEYLNSGKGSQCIKSLINVMLD